MRNFDPAKSFGQRTAARYDDVLRGDEQETVDFLEVQARGGPVLELAIGTGRIGLPLSQRGLRVDGIEISDAMVEQLRKKPEGDRIEVTMGDYAAVPVEGKYKLIYVVYNTIYNLLTQDD
jgi:16S rRNA A1518/A1519 N6-dimethyltransferase RsmA/KsgA/DIM1 with predicted DNA glycosylase/AP lyase activity